MLDIFKNNVLFTGVADLYNQFLPSPEQKALQDAMKVDFGYATYENYLPYAQRVIKAYSPKGADGIRSHPTASHKANLEILDMTEAYIAGQSALAASDDHTFMTQFDRLLAMAPVNEASFNGDMAMIIAGELAGIQDPSGPPTAVQIKALEKWQQQLFQNAENTQPFGGHSYASGSRMRTAQKAGESLEKGYERHNLPKENMRTPVLVS